MNIRIARSRRQFLRDSAALVAAGACLPRFLTRTAAAVAAAPAASDRVLVVLQLTGGNDGLNTVIPHRDDAYYAARPTLAIARGRTLKLDDDMGLHPSLRGLKSLFDDGQLAVVQSVGYPNPDRSHFSAMDIWHCAETGLVRRDAGWLGRAADAAERDAAHPWAIHLDDDALPLALRARTVAVPSIRDISSLRLEAGGEPMKRAIETQAAAPRNDASDLLAYVQRASVAACTSARRLEQIGGDDGGAGRYPNLNLARKLRQIAALIGADFGARVYYTSLAGFDTHAKQRDVHAALLSELGDSVAAFFRDLKTRGLSERVLLMTFSEFGRRVRENGSQGTDHGAAAPLFIAGADCAAGVVGDRPSLTDLDDGDVRYSMDFRRVYATVLQRHLGLDAAAVLGGKFADAPILKG